MMFQQFGGYMGVHIHFHVFDVQNGTRALTRSRDFQFQCLKSLETSGLPSHWVAMSH